MCLDREQKIVTEVHVSNSVFLVFYFLRSKQNIVISILADGNKLRGGLY